MHCRLRRLCRQSSCRCWLNRSDVDAIYDAGEGAPMSGLMISEYFGIQPTVMDTTGVGGSSASFIPRMLCERFAKVRQKLRC